MGKMTVVCLDAKSGKGRSTGLVFLSRYEVLAEEPVSPTCVYCGRDCSKIDVGVGGGAWCRLRFALAPPGKDVFLEAQSLRQKEEV